MSQKLLSQAVYWLAIALLFVPILYLAHWNDGHPRAIWPIVACFVWLIVYVSVGFIVLLARDRRRKVSK